MKPEVGSFHPYFYYLSAWWFCTPFFLAAVPLLNLIRIWTNVFSVALCTGRLRVWFWCSSVSYRSCTFWRNQKKSKRPFSLSVTPLPCKYFVHYVHSSLFSVRNFWKTWQTRNLNMKCFELIDNWQTIVKMWMQNVSKEWYKHSKNG